MIDKVYNDLADLSIGRLQKGVRGKARGCSSVIVIKASQVKKSGDGLTEILRLLPRVTVPRNC